MLILKRWYGRLGNNIIQLSNIIDIALKEEHNIKFNVKGLKFFDISVIKNYFDKYNNKKIYCGARHFFKDKGRVGDADFDRIAWMTRKHMATPKELLGFQKNIFNKNAEERNKILQKAFLINNIHTLNENDLVIHIRSGDIFRRKPHHLYIPPPLSYYIKEINKYNYEKIYIICEDKKNPVVNKLLELYKNAIHNKNTLKEDIRIILGAKNIMYSIGSFIPSLMLLSNNIKFIHKHFNSFKNEKNEYYKIMKPWKNTKTQKNYILTYDYN